MPEALLNGIALLGWNPPHRDNPAAISKNLKEFLSYEKMDLKDIESGFNIDKIGKSPVKVDLGKLEFLNS